MAESAKLVAIDPNGDTLIILKNPKADLPKLKEEREHKDEDMADSLSGDAAEEFASDGAAGGSDIIMQEAPAVSFLVSSRQLRIVSPYFDNMLKRSYGESVPNPDDGLYHIMAEGWCSEAMEVVLNIAHVQVKRILDCISLKLFVKILVIADYYQMQDTIALYTKLWMLQLKGVSKPAVYCEEAVYWLFIAFQLKENVLFSDLATKIIKTASNGIETLDLPFAPVVQEKLNCMRDAAIRKVYSAIQLLKQNLYVNEAGCSDACNAMLLGSFVQNLHKYNLLAFIQPHTSQSFANIRLDMLWVNLSQIRTPDWYESPQCKRRHGCELAPRFKTICSLSAIQIRVVPNKFGP